MRAGCKFEGISDALPLGEMFLKYFPRQNTLKGNIMYKKKLNLRISIGIIFLISVFMIIKINTIINVQESELNHQNLQSWIGEYNYFEFCEPNINMSYSISLYREKDIYYSTINIDGFQTMNRLKARVIGDDKQIKLIFESYLHDNHGELFNEGDVLISLYREDLKVITEWNEIKSIFLDATPKGIYFELEK